MQKKGMYLGGYRPFGFLPDPNDCHKLILDPVASQYVRLIFELALQGNRTGTIEEMMKMWLRIWRGHPWRSCALRQFCEVLHHNLLHM